MAWQFREIAFRAAVLARLGDVPTDDRAFVAALIGVDQATLENFTGGDALTVNRLCAIANLEGFSPHSFFEDT